MKKILIRKKVLDLGSVNSHFIFLTSKEYRSKKKLVEDFGYETLLNQLFEEKEETYESLLQSYNELLKSGEKENDKFFVAYQMNENFGVYLNANIYLYHLPARDKVYTKIVPWGYADSEKYLGDTWWEADEEILENIQKMSILEFLENYKGYFG